MRRHAPSAIVALAVVLAALGLTLSSLPAPVDAGTSPSTTDVVCAVRSSRSRVPT